MVYHIVENDAEFLETSCRLTPLSFTEIVDHGIRVKARSSRIGY